MKISSALLKPSIFDLETQYRELAGQVREDSTDFVTELRNFIHRSLGELEVLKLAVSSLDESKGLRIPEDVYEKIRLLKLELRFALRKWKRLSDAKLRQAGKQEKNVPTFAA